MKFSHLENGEIYNVGRIIRRNCGALAHPENAMLYMNMATSIRFWRFEMCHVVFLPPSFLADWIGYWR